MNFTDFIKNTNWINKGDTIYVISDMLPLTLNYRARGEKLNLDAVIDFLKECVGPEGNILFPTFNWDFCKGIAFDARKTPCRTGALAKAALKRADFIRTKHPLYSFAVWGKNSLELAAIDCKDAFGPGTIFDKMSELNAKALVIGIPALSGFTYVHHVEQMVGVPYRYSKDFSAEYTDLGGNTSTKTYSMYVRDLDMDPRHIEGFKPLEEIMINDGIIKREMYDDVMCSFMNAVDTFEPIRKDIKENDSKNMYTYNHL
ncbi:MAG: AAC(3) family N-acetyltransferase [Lachnospiraceae bacterium]|nr:AAC(3) family N-acetyltransferase [Lachnospiraceae bacterium]